MATEPHPPQGADPFDGIVKHSAERPELALAWERQRETARELCKRFDHGFDTQLLGDEVGMGKTYVALATVANFVAREDSNGGRALLVTPSSSVLRSKWEQEIRSFSSSYLHQAGGGSLKPLVVNGFWEFVANLHDHDNGKIQRVSEAGLTCILFYLRRWAVRKRWLTNKHLPWSEIADFDLESPDAIKFSSTYSIAAFEAFLEKENAQKNGTLRKLLEPKGELFTAPESARSSVRELFKRFVCQQDRFEPNVFILGMNALGKPRINSEETRRFTTFALSVLLKWQRQDTYKSVLAKLRKVGLLKVKVRIKDIEAMADVDLYHMRASVSSALADDTKLGTIWNGVLKDPKSAEMATLKDFFSRLIYQAVFHKLKHSNIRLAVVDEAHNWKGGKHGARRFRDHFADAIPSKLLMSATPFQLAEGEMRTLFDFAASKDGPTDKALQTMFEPNGLVEKCLAANTRFLAAWSRLGLADVRFLMEEVQHFVDPEALLKSCSDPTQGLTPLSDFCDHALAYRQAVNNLSAEQRKIMIRHLKSRQHRRFHAGEDFMTDKIERTSLYKIGGRSAPEDTFINYLAMRLDQRVRADSRTREGEVVNAHLVRGMSSSREAFNESHRELHTMESRKLQFSAETRGYSDMFKLAIAQSRHPKVSATVEHALHNYLRGRKTLIFCERVASVREISLALHQRIEASLGELPSGFDSIRDQIPDQHLFADFQLYRSWRRVFASGVDVDDPRVRERAKNYVKEKLQTASARLTERRVLRLLDLWFFSEEFQQPMKSKVCVTLFAKLADSMEGTTAEGVLNLKSRDGEENNDQGKIIEIEPDEFISNVLDNGFLSGLNLWSDSDASEFDNALWTLIEDEAKKAVGDDTNCSLVQALGFHNTLLGPYGLQTGIRRIVLKPDLLRQRLSASPELAPQQAVFDGIRQVKVEPGGVGVAESAWQKVIRFLHSLGQANGSMNPIDKTNTRRRSLWRGVERTGDDRIGVLDGSIAAQSRVTLCAAFNSPLTPEILICTSVGSEGIDLHTECAEVIHHDLPWNPARLEQRNGRIDRVGRLAESTGGHVRIGIPFQAHNYDQFQYDKVLSRAQLFEVLLGRPDFNLEIDEELCLDREAREGDEEDSEGSIRDADAEEDATNLPPLVVLPERIVDWLRIDLSLHTAPAS